MNERGKFPRQPVAIPRGTIQDNVFAVENTSTESLKDIIRLFSGRQLGHEVQYPSHSKPFARFIPPSPPSPVPMFSSIMPLHLIQIKHLIFLRLLTLIDLPRLTMLSCLKILGRSSKM